MIECCDLLSPRFVVRKVMKDLPPRPEPNSGLVHGFTYFDTTSYCFSYISWRDCLSYIFGRQFSSDSITTHDLDNLRNVTTNEVSKVWLLCRGECLCDSVDDFPMIVLRGPYRRELPTRASGGQPDPALPCPLGPFGNSLLGSAFGVRVFLAACHVRFPSNKPP